MGSLVRVCAVELLEEYKVRLEFEDGTRKELDLEPYLRGLIFNPIRNDSAVFRSIKVRDGTVTWENGADIAPDVLYYDELRPAWMEKREPV